MSWFGRRSSPPEADSAMAAEKTDLMMGSDNSSEAVNFGGDPHEHFDSGVRASDGTADAQALQRIVMQEQQKALVQQVIAKLTEVSFDTCIEGKPDSALSARQRTCVHTVVGKYLDTSEFVIGRATKQRTQH